MSSRCLALNYHVLNWQLGHWDGIGPFFLSLFPHTTALYGCLPSYLSPFLSVSLPIRLPSYLSPFQSFSLPICLPSYMSPFLSVSLPICLPSYLSLLLHYVSPVSLSPTSSPLLSLLCLLYFLFLSLLLLCLLLCLSTTTLVSPSVFPPGPWLSPCLVSCTMSYFMYIVHVSTLSPLHICLLIVSTLISRTIRLIFNG